MLKTNDFMEAALKALGSKMRETIKPPKNPGDDPTKLCEFDISDLPAKFLIPANAEIGEIAAGTFPDIDYVIYYVDVCPKPNSVRVHFHKGLKPIPGEYIHGRFTMIGKYWNPCDWKGNDIEINKRNGKDTVRNYGPMLDVHPCEEQGRHELKIYDCSSKDYKYPDVGRVHPWEVNHLMWAFQNGFGNEKRDQHIAFVEARRERRTVMSEALETAGVVKTQQHA